MILVVSRFRVRNGIETSVRDAFLARPRLVDGVPGFLGLEVFTDTGDPSVFHLVTRWTDHPSFEAWHGGDAHDQAHRAIPKGLKLDPSHTQVLELQRVEDPSRPAEWEQVVADAVPALASFLSESAAACCLLLDPDGAIRACNPALSKLLGRPFDQLHGQPASLILTEASARSLTERIAAGERRLGERVLLRFVDASGRPVMLRCLVDVHPDRLLLIGEPPEDRAASDTGIGPTR